MKAIFLIIAAIFVLSCAALSEQSTIQKSNKERIEKLRSIKFGDGINFEEAEILSSEYFGRHVSGCGIVGKPTDEGEYWVSIAYFGFAGVPLEEPIKIEKKTGTISMKGYPTIFNPLKEWNISP